MFQLTAQEKQEVIAICDNLKLLKFSSTLPYVFTEHGALMAASVLNTKRAVEISVFVVRAFVKLREMIANHKELSYKFAELERKLPHHDEAIQSLVDAIRKLMTSPAEPPKPKIGFITDGVKMKNKNVGSNFEDFLKEEGILEETREKAFKSVLAKVNKRHKKTFKKFAK